MSTVEVAHFDAALPPLPDPQATPVDERRPEVNWAQPVAAPVRWMVSARRVVVNREVEVD